MTILGIFSCKVKDIILCEVSLNPHEVRLKQTSENSETQKNSNFLFGWRGVGGGAGGGWQAQGAGVPDGGQ